MNDGIDALIFPKLDTDTIIIDQLLMRFEPTAVPKEVARIDSKEPLEERLVNASPIVWVTPALSSPLTSNAKQKIKSSIDQEMPEFTRFKVSRRKAKPPMRRIAAPPKAGHESGKPYREANM